MNTPATKTIDGLFDRLDGDDAGKLELAMILLRMKGAQTTFARADGRVRCTITGPRGTFTGDGADDSSAFASALAAHKAPVGRDT